MKTLIDVSKVASRQAKGKGVFTLCNPGFFTVCDGGGKTFVHEAAFFTFALNHSSTQTVYMPNKRTLIFTAERRKSLLVFCSGKIDACGILNEKETEFLCWACTAFSCKEIPDTMGSSPRTMDAYRNAWQDRLDRRERIGLAMCH